MASIKAHAFRRAVEQADTTWLAQQLEKIAKQLRVSSRDYAIILQLTLTSFFFLGQTFRSAHRKRTNHYLNVECPEHLLMTAGSSTIDPEAHALTVQDLVKHVDDGLREKMIRSK